MTGLQKLVRRALLTKLKGNLALTSLVPAASINPVGTPTWPFIVLRSSTTQRLKASCVNGGLVTWTVHAFAGPRESGGAVVETGEDFAGSIGAAIEAALADNWLALPDGAKARIRVSDIALQLDGDPDHWHWVCQVNARVLA